MVFAIVILIYNGILKKLYAFHDLVGKIPSKHQKAVFVWKDSNGVMMEQAVFLALHLPLNVLLIQSQMPNKNVIVILVTKNHKMVKLASLH